MLQYTNWHHSPRWNSDDQCTLEHKGKLAEVSYLLCMNKFKRATALRTSDRRSFFDTPLTLAKMEYIPYASASRDDSYNCERICNNGGCYVQIALTKCSCDSHQVSLGFTIFSSEKTRTAWTPFNAAAFFGE